MLPVIYGSLKQWWIRHWHVYIS